MTRSREIRYRDWLRPACWLKGHDWQHTTNSRHMGGTWVVTSLAPAFRRCKRCGYLELRKMTKPKPPAWPETLFLVVFVWLPILGFLTATVYTVATLWGQL